MVQGNASSNYRAKPDCGQKNTHGISAGIVDWEGKGLA